MSKLILLWENNLKSSHMFVCFLFFFLKKIQQSLVKIIKINIFTSSQFTNINLNEAVSQLAQKNSELF